MSAYKVLTASLSSGNLNLESLYADLQTALQLKPPGLSAETTREAGPQQGDPSMERSTRPLQPSADGPAAAEQAGPELSPSDEAWAARVAAMAHRYGMA